MTGAMWTMLAVAAFLLFAAICSNVDANRLAKAAPDDRNPAASRKAAHAMGGTNALFGLSMLAWIALGILFAVRELLT